MKEGVQVGVRSAHLASAHAQARGNVNPFVLVAAQTSKCDFVTY